MERDPHLLEGMVIGAFAMRASLIFIYIRGEFVLGYRTLVAPSSRHAEGVHRINVLGSGWSIDIILHRGAGAYICGEEAGADGSLEGKRGYPDSSSVSRQLWGLRQPDHHP